MRLLKTNGLLYRYVLKQVKSNLYNLVNAYIDKGLLNELVLMYGKQTIIDSIDSIYYDGSFICIPSNTTYGTILKFLQYGGPKIKAYNLLSMSTGGVL